MGTCNVKGCNAQVINGHHCACGHVQVRQLSIYGQLRPSAAVGEALQAEAIDRVEAGPTVDDFIEAVLALIRRTEIGLMFTTDSIWSELRQQPPDPRAMGAAMRAAQREGLIKPLNDWRLSKRPACHRRPLRVWQRIGGFDELGTDPRCPVGHPLTKAEQHAGTCWLCQHIERGA